MCSGGSPDSVIATAAPGALSSDVPLPLSPTATGGGWMTEARTCRPLSQELPPLPLPLPPRPPPLPPAAPPPPPLPQPPPSLPPPSPLSGSSEAVCDATAGDALFLGASARSLQTSPMAREWLLGEAWGGADPRTSPQMTALGVRAAALFSINIFSAGGRGPSEDPRVPVPPGGPGLAVEPRDVVSDDGNVQFKYYSLVRAWVCSCEREVSGSAGAF